MKLLFTFLAASVALAAGAQKPCLYFEDGQYVAKGLPAHYVVRHGAKDDDHETYYLLIQKGYLDSLKVLYGNKDSLKSAPVKTALRHYADVNVTFQTVPSAPDTILSFPTTPFGTPWLNDEDNTLTLLKIKND